MLLKTHLAITIFAILFFIQNIENKFIFVFVALISTFIPDIDSRYSSFGRKKINRIFQFFTQHRGVTHSFVFLFILTFVLALVWPIGALGFFLGYGLHLFADSFTPDGIKPFYPFFKVKSKGRILTGGRTEIFLFFIFVILDVSMFFVKIF